MICSIAYSNICLYVQNKLYSIRQHLETSIRLYLPPPSTVTIGHMHTNNKLGQSKEGKFKEGKVKTGVHPDEII